MMNFRYRTSKFKVWSISELHWWKNQKCLFWFSLLYCMTVWKNNLALKLFLISSETRVKLNELDLNNKVLRFRIISLKQRDHALILSFRVLELFELHHWWAAIKQKQWENFLQYNLWPYFSIAEKTPRSWKK